jgi:rare lipoprotein A
MQQNGNGFTAGLATLAGALAFLALPSIADAKSPGHRHCAVGVCHRVMTLAETEAQIGKVRRLTASHYDDCHHDRFNPCGLTSSGEVFRADKPDNAASAIHPDGTILLLRNPATGLAAVVRVNNFGPFHRNRKLDVSRATAERLGFARRGVASLEVMIVHAPTAAETRYARKRHYDPVPGFIGSAATFDTAYQRYADLTLHKRIARHDAVACRIAAKRRAPRLKLVASLAGDAYTRLARN